MSGVTLIGSSGASVVDELAVVFDVRATTSSAWIPAAELRLERLAVHAASQDLDELKATNPYGSFLLPGETSFASAAEPINLMGYWIRARAVGGTGVDVLFIGRVYAEARKVLGTGPDTSGGSDVRRGWQTWHAYGARQELRRTWVSSWYWDDPQGEEGVPQLLGWSPGFNLRDRHGFTVGNRSADLVGSSYVFGGSSLWTRRQALEYFILRHAPGSWALSGQLELLEGLVEPFRLPPTISGDQLLRRLIPREAGIDFRVWTFETSSGDLAHTIYVFSLLPEEVSFAGETLTANTEQVELDVATIKNLERVEVSRDNIRNYSRIRIVGARLLVCGTLEGSSGAGSLLPSWGASEEAAYKDGAYSGVARDASPEEHDRARRGEEVATVYQRFAAPAEWGRPTGFSPRLDGAGELAGDGPAQDVTREALSWLPLRAGWDYSTSSPTNGNPTGVLGEFLPPLLATKDLRATADASAERWALLEELGGGLSVLREDLGVRVHLSPPHLGAAGNFDPSDSDTSASEVDPSATPAGACAYEDHRATVAWRGDSRFVLEAELEGGDGSSLDVPMPSAECWLLAPSTVYGVSSSGALLRSPAEVVELRNDRARVAAYMAGLLARYFNRRARASVTFRGLLPWGGLVGQILATAADGGSGLDIRSPITSVVIERGSKAYRTTVRAGYA